VKNHVPQTASGVSRALRKVRNPKKARTLKSFFKTGPGEYGEGDRFLGVTVPAQRAIASQFSNLAWKELRQLIQSPWHEERFTGLLIAGRRYRDAEKRGKSNERRRIAEDIIRFRNWVNSWDLVDYIAPTVIGPYLLPKDRRRHRQLLRSRSIWDRRIAIVGTLPSIRAGQTQDALASAATLIRDPEDLIRKAAGWMLREVGKVQPVKLTSFLNRHAAVMPRTMLRYAVERLPQAQRRAYLKMHVFQKVKLLVN